MNPTKEEIAIVLKNVDEWVEEMNPKSPSVILASAYRAEKQDADDLEKYVAELVAQVNKEKARAELAERQYAELLDYQRDEESGELDDLTAIVFYRHTCERRALKGNP
jgi:hypothetical protein